MASKHSRESLIKAIKGYAGKSTGRISVIRFCQVSRISPSTVLRYFPQGFREFLAAAGFEDRFRVGRADHASLMSELDRIARLVGRVPMRADVSRHGRLRPETYRARIGRWERTIRAYERWKSSSKGQEAASAAAARASEAASAPGAEGTARECRPEGPRMPAGAEAVMPPRVMGPPLGFRGLLHAPINELGVIHLFGLLGPDLGIAVEHIGHAYPDCSALRPEPGGHKWRRIAVEFELKSSNFRLHNHDPALCDLVVCWVHDWKECPVEVLELKSVMANVMGRAA